MKKIFAGLLVGVGVLTSASAHGWGSYGQGVLTGIAGVWMVEQIARPNAIININGNPVNINPQYVPAPSGPVYVSPPYYTEHQPQQFCESVPIVDQFGAHRTVQYCYWR